MRLPVDNIKKAILHPMDEFRSLAIEYFADSHTDDTSIMPLVIEAVRRYGEQHGFHMLRMAFRLPQTCETVEWMVEELQQDNRPNNYRYAVATVLLHTDPKLLLEKGVETSRLRHFPKKLHRLLEDWLEMQGWDWDTLWNAMVEMTEKLCQKPDNAGCDWTTLQQMVELLGAGLNHGAILRMMWDHLDELNPVLRCSVMEIAGQMRLAEAVPVLVDQLYETDIQVMESPITALSMINGDGVVQALATEWREGSDDFKDSAVNVLDHVHTDLCARYLLRFLQAEEDNDLQLVLGHSILYQFEHEGIWPVRRLVVGDPVELDREQRDLRYHLVAAATMMEAEFPERDQWFQEAVAHNWGGKIKKVPDLLTDKWWDLDDQCEWN